MTIKFIKRYMAIKKGVTIGLKSTPDVTPERYWASETLVGATGFEPVTLCL